MSQDTTCSYHLMSQFLIPLGGKSGRVIHGHWQFSGGERGVPAVFLSRW